MGSSSLNGGFRLLGSQRMSDDFRALFEVEYANDEDFQNNPNDFAVNYLELMGGVGFKTLVNVKVGRELLGSDGGEFAFQTPLATGHKFNGWADKFLVTPKDGLIDWYVSADGKVRTVSWLVIYHDFNAEFGGASYGSELDASVTYPTSWKQVFAAKFALYREDGFSTDTRKFWVWTQYSF